MEAPITVEMERLPEKIFDLEEVDECMLRDKHGQTKYFKEIRHGHKCIIVFIRHFHDYVTRDYVEDFSKIFPRDLQDHNVKIIVIGCAPSRFINQFVEETNFPHEMYCDSRKIIHKVLNFHDRYASSLSGSVSPHVKSNAFIGFWQTVWRTVKSSVEQGDPFQQGGQIVVNEDGKILLFHRDVNPLDHTPINDLLKVAGLGRIDFKTKYKIYDV